MMNFKSVEVKSIPTIEKAYREVILLVGFLHRLINISKESDYKKSKDVSCLSELRGTRENKSSVFGSVLAIVVIIFALGMYLYMNNGIDDTSPEVPATYGFVAKSKAVTYDYNSHAGAYAGRQNCFYFYTKDGISYRNAAGEILWDDAFDMITPKITGSGDFVAVSETSGLQARVYGPGGFLYDRSFEQPVINFTVNSAGWLCVKLQKGSDYVTEIYDEKGEEVQGRKHEDYNLFPIASAMAPNGKQLVQSFLDINGVQLQSHLFFYSLNADKQWGGRTKDNQIIGSLKFMSDYSLIAVSDLELNNYVLDDNNVLSDGKVLVLSNEIKKLEYLDDKGVALVLGQGLTNEESLPENLVQLYNADLNLSGEFQCPKEVTYLSASSHGAIVGSGSTYYGLNTKASQIWQYNAPKELKALLFINSDTVVELGYTEMRVLKRERIKSPSPTEEQGVM